MAAFVDMASSILTQASRSLDVSAQNISNISTPGYKRRVEFSQVLAGGDVRDLASSPVSAATDYSLGKLVETGNPHDLALSGEGFFTLRAADGSLVYTRNGQFRRDAEGRLVSEAGAALQADGGDLVLHGDAFQVASDGAVLEAGAPVGRLDLVTLAPGAGERTSGGGFVADEGEVGEVAAPAVRQGAFEASNVAMGGEMIAMMAALRRAEAGQHLIGVYDDLMGRVITTFGQG